MNNKSKIVRPIRFAKLELNSRYKIFAEPSRGIAKSHDSRVYIKEAESYSVDAADPERAIILMPEDLVQPLTRGHK